MSLLQETKCYLTENMGFAPLLWDGTLTGKHQLPQREQVLLVKSIVPDPGEQVPTHSIKGKHSALRM